MFSIGTAVFRATIGLLLNKGGDKVAEILKDGDVTDQKFHALIARENDDIKSKLHALSRKDLEASINFFEEGIALLYEVFDTARSRSEYEATLAKELSLEPTRLDESVARMLSNAKIRFKNARIKAKVAFANEAFKTSERILAMRYRLMATILETVDNPSDAVAPCRVCVEELNSLPAVQASFDVELKKGLRGFINRVERREIISSVCHVNRVVYDVAQAVSEEPHLWILPPIDTGRSKIDPLRDERLIKVLRKQGMEHCLVTPWPFDEEGEEEHKKPRALPEIAPPPEILARGRLAVKAFNKALAQGQTSNKRVPIMLIGQDRSGKTSLKNSLRGQTFNQHEDSTVGIDADPSHFQVVHEVWKPGEKDQGDSEAALSYEHHVARLTVANLRQERSIPSETASPSMQSESISQRNPSLTSESSDSTTASPSASSTPSTISLSFSEDPKSSKTLRDPESGEGIQDITEQMDDGKIEDRDPEFGDGIPSVTEDIATLIERLLRKDSGVEDKEEIYSVLWDFAGQLVYYTTHALFLTTRAIYILVNDLSQNPNEVAKPVVKQGMFEELKTGFDLKTNLDYLDFWMSSVALLASQNESIPEPSDSKVLPDKLPPVFLVCTHADMPYGGANPDKLGRKVFGSLRTKQYKGHLYKEVFVVDNTKSGHESECSGVARLRKKILDVAKELPQMKETIPIKWLRYEKTIQTMKDNGHKWIDLEDAKEIASKVCQIVDNEEFKTLLNFLHDQRVVIHFDDTPELNKLVVLNPQWLIDVFKEVITIRPYKPEEETFEHLWRDLENTGMLDEELLDHVWSPLLHKEGKKGKEERKETSEKLITIMEKFSLLCQWPSSDESSRKRYLVPSMLQSHPPTDIKNLVASAQIPSLFLRFDSGHVPPGLFARLLLQFFRFQYAKDKDISAECPKFYQNFARFYHSEDEDCSVILVCHKSSIEVAIHRCNPTHPVLAESQQSTLNLCGNVSYRPFDVNCGRTVRRQLVLILESMRKEFSWLKNMRYEVSFMCPVCRQGCLFSDCLTHRTEGCELEECLHFLSEADLYKAKKTVRCEKRLAALDNRVHVERFSPWLTPKESQLPANEHGGGKLDCVDGGKQLTLPDVVEKSVLSRSCDAKEVVLKLKESLRLDQTSLEKPDSETKQLIRCLARKAKDSNRSDVFEHLREIAPAGTTGPLLPENLDVRNIPFSKARELTIDLSGGDNWKEVAEGLGLTPQEIRFLDNRTLNPFEAVLSFVARQRYITVSELYDLLNKHGLPVVADIL